MPLLARMVAFPLSIDVRGGAVEGLADLLADRRISPYGHVAVAVGPGQGEHLTGVLREALAEADVFPVGGGTIEAAQALADQLRRGDYDAVVGIGGGRVLDATKYAASITGLPLVTVATSLAHDGLASPVASLEHGDTKGSFGVHTPLAVVVDLDYVRSSPVEQVRAGLGDALSNLSALADWELAHRERGDPVDGLAAALARSASESLLHQTAPLDSEQFLTTLAHALIQGGLSMAVAGNSRPCSGACHEIAHAIEALHPGAVGHGLQVAVGMLFASYLREDPRLDAFDACLRRYGVARVPADIGLTTDEFVAAVVKAPSTRPDRYTILESLAMDESEARARVEAFIERFAPASQAPEAHGISSAR